MLESLPVLIFIGTILGFLAGIGVGGGSLLILWLTIVQDASPETARGINLLFFIPSAVIASFFRWRQGTLHLKTVFPAILAGCLSAAVFSWIGLNADTAILKKLFGILLIITGLRELRFQKKS